MSSSAAKSGLVIFLLSVTVVHGQHGSGVTYSSTQICAPKGSTVDIPCTYTYPPRWNERDVEAFWFREMNGNDPVDLRSDSDYTGRVEYHFHENGCTLRIKDLRESDSAEYKFTLRTNKPDQSLTGSPGVSLSVTALQVQVTKVYWTSDPAELKCHSSCSPAGQLSYIWFKDGEKIQTETSSFSVSYDTYPSYACALKGHEDSPSPSVCVYSKVCNKVTYDKRRICALKGSSVNISCTYYPYVGLNSLFWFSPASSHHWQNPTQPADLKEDSQEAGRVQVFVTQRGRSTLRISDLRESDSAEYRLKFKTSRSDWGNSLPGTTLTVTALQVQVTSVTVHQDYTEAVLRCHHSCPPAGYMSHIWFKNGKEIPNEEKSSHEDRFYPGDSISCALKGLENVSPSVYALKAPSVSVSPPGEITEGSSVTLKCSSDANREANYTWLKRNQTLPREEPQLVFTSIQPSDSGEYRCTSENELGKRTSEPVFIDVKYAPQLPSVSVSPSAEIMEGSSVTLTCSSDANPAANYTWYKENEDSPKASGPVFTITDFRAEHSGNYSCEAHNGIGRHNSTLLLIVVAGAWTSTAVGTSLAVVFVILLLVVFILIRKKRASKRSAEIGETAGDTQEQSRQEAQDLNYSSVQFITNPDQNSCARPVQPEPESLYSCVRPVQPEPEPLYSCVRPVQQHGRQLQEDPNVVYAAVTINKRTSAQS